MISVLVGNRRLIDVRNVVIVNHINHIKNGEYKRRNKIKRVKRRISYDGLFCSIQTEITGAF